MAFWNVFISASAAVGVWNLTIAILGLFPRFRATAVGTLKKRSTRRNAWYGTHKFPVMTHYTYTYKVGKREYRYSSNGTHTKRGLYPKVTMVYVKGFPRRAYPHKFKGTREWAWGIFWVLMAVLFGMLFLLAQAGAIPK